MVRHLNPRSIHQAHRPKTSGSMTVEDLLAIAKAPQASAAQSFHRARFVSPACSANRALTNHSPVSK